MSMGKAPRRRRPAPSLRDADIVDSISASALAEAAHTSKQTIYDAMNSGELRSFMLGGRRMIRLSAWRDFCAQRETTTARPNQRPPK
jgi:hypothetical protein